MVLGFGVLTENSIANVYYEGNWIHYGTDGFIYQQQSLQLSNKNHNIDVEYLPEIPMPYEETINLYLQNGSWKSLSDYLDWYETQLNHDGVLLNFSRAMIHRANRESHRAIPLYEKILQDNPDYIFVRYAYAQSLFENKRYKDAKREFDKLPLSNFSSDTQRNIQAYQQHILNAQKIKTDIEFNYEQNDNINQVSADPVVTIDGRVFQKNKESMPKKDTGIYYGLSFDKEKNISGNHYIVADLSLSGRHYLKFDEYNEQNIQLGVGYAYKNQKTNWQIKPLYIHHLLDDKSYYQDYGVDLGMIYDISPHWQYRMNYLLKDRNYQEYDGLDGIHHHKSMAVIYHKNDHALFFGLNHQIENTDNHQYDNQKSGMMVGVQYDINDNIGVQARYLFAKREFDDRHELMSVPRVDREKTYHLSLFHPRWQYRGIKPALNWVYKDVKSNIPQLYQYQSHQIHLSLYREF